MAPGAYCESADAVKAAHSSDDSNEPYKSAHSVCHYLEKKIWDDGCLL